jgi:hypothetical protein
VLPGASVAAGDGQSEKCAQETGASSRQQNNIVSARQAHVTATETAEQQLLGVCSLH